MASGRTRTITPKSMESWAYLAGIIDGEGHFGLRAAGRGQLRLVVVNTHKPLIDWLHKNFKGTVNQRRKAADNHRSLWAWQLAQRRDLLYVCANIEPYLIEKKAWAYHSHDFLIAALEGDDKNRWNAYKRLEHLTSLRKER